MSIPKKKRSVARRGRRNGAPEHKLTAKNVVRCSNCNAPTLRHYVCNSCGVYKGVEIIKRKEKKEE